MSMSDSEQDGNGSTDWKRRGVSVDPETDEKFSDIIGYDSYSFHVRNLLTAFVRVHEAYREEEKFIDVNKLPELMADAAIREIQSED